MTFEEMASLSAGINRLTSNNLAKVVQIIKENMPSLGAGSEEIEVDINALDNRTLWKLHNFVESCKATKKKPKKRPAETADSRRRASAESLASTTQELMQVEAGLHAIEEPRGPQGIAFQQQDDNDSPADSASDSNDGGSALPIGAAGSSNGGQGGNQAWSDFANAPKQREREQQEEEAPKRQRQQEEPVYRCLSSEDNPEAATAGWSEHAEVAPEAAGAAGMAPNDGCRDDASDAGTDRPEDDFGAEDDIEDMENALPNAGVVMAVESGGGSP